MYTICRKIFVSNDLKDYICFVYSECGPTSVAHEVMSIKSSIVDKVIMYIFLLFYIGSVQIR